MFSLPRLGFLARLSLGVVASGLSLWLSPIPAVHAGDIVVQDGARVLTLVYMTSPVLYAVFYWGYWVTPFLFFFVGSHIVESVITVWLKSLQEYRTRGQLPPWPASHTDERPSLVLGEVHYQTELREHPHPTWCVIPEKGLYTGLIIFGAIGTGKTAACMKPFSRQLLSWQHHDKEKRAAALVLEVKGDFCYDVQEVLKEYGRLDDYMEVSLGEDANMWNPMAAPWLDTYTLAYSLASLMNQLFGSGKEPFWQQAYTSTIRWIIECFRSFPDPWFTLADIYLAMVDPAKLDELITRQESQTFEKYRFQINIDQQDYEKHRGRLDSISISVDDVDNSKSLDQNSHISPLAFTPQEAEAHNLAKSSGGEAPKKTFNISWHPNQGAMSCMVGDLAGGVLRWELNREGHQIPYEQAVRSEPTPDELGLTDEIGRWYRCDWLGLDEKLRSSIVVGMAVFLGIFVVPNTRRVFCPPSPKKMTKEERARLLPPLDEVIESGTVLALNMPAGTSAALARAVGVMLKSNWLSTLLLRPKRMKLDLQKAKEEGRKPKYWRPAVFICDEYQSFATCGESDPSGDEKAFALTRQSRCIPIVATQSISSLRSVLGEGESWRALLQTLRSRIFLSLGDDFSQKTASELTGQVTRLKASYSLSENTGKASVSLLTGRVGGAQASAGLSKSYAKSREPLFHPRDFLLQKICQSICQVFDGNSVKDATRVYLKPDFKPRDEPYWRGLGAEDVI